MEQIDPRRGRAAASGTGPTPGGRATWRSSSSPGQGDENADEPDHQPPLGHVAHSGRPRRRRCRAADTVYSVTPLYHPSGLMMSVGGAIAGGARLAMATEFDPSTFWEEVRRYGVTVASYTWTMLHELVEAPPAAGRAPPPGAPVHRARGCRAACGGGSSERFAPGARARVLRLDRDRARSSSTCATPSRARWGGRCPAAPRCGSPPTTSTPASSCSARRVRARMRDRRGRACCSRARGPARGSRRSSLRGVFARDDAWLATGDLFRRDADGDYWRLDGVGEVIRTRRGRCSRRRSATRSATCRPSTWRSRTASPGRAAVTIAVAAVTLEPGGELIARELTDGAARRCRAPSARRSSTSSTGSPSPRGTGRSPARCATRACPERARPAGLLPGSRADGYRRLTAADRRRLSPDASSRPAENR